MICAAAARSRQFGRNGSRNAPLLMLCATVNSSPVGLPVASGSESTEAGLPRTGAQRFIGSMVRMTRAAMRRTSASAERTPFSATSRQGLKGANGHHAVKERDDVGAALIRSHVVRRGEAIDELIEVHGVR